MTILNDEEGALGGEQQPFELLRSQHEIEEMGLQDLLVDTFNSILKAEGRMAKQMGPRGLTINEIHLLEAIAKSGESGTNLGALAAEFRQKKPMIAFVVNKVARKGYIEKWKDPLDARASIIVATEKGKEIVSVLYHLHKNMVESLHKRFSDEEMATLKKGVRAIDEFYMHSFREEGEDPTRDDGMLVL